MTIFLIQIIPIVSFINYFEIHFWFQYLSEKPKSFWHTLKKNLCEERYGVKPCIYTILSIYTLIFTTSCW